MSSTPIFKVRPDPNESFRGGSSQHASFLVWRLRPGVLFYYRSVFDFEKMALGGRKANQKGGLRGTGMRGRKANQNPAKKLRGTLHKHLDLT